MKLTNYLLFLCTLSFFFAPLRARGDDIGQLRAEIQTARDQITELNTRVTSLQSSANGDLGMSLFVAGIFFALWAKNSGRSAVLWFFLGAVPTCTLFALPILLYKNAADLRRAHQHEPLLAEP